MGHSFSYPSILVAVAFTGFFSNADVLAQEAEESHNVRLLGHDDLQARSAYHPVIQRQIIDGTERWIAYVGHHGGQALNPLSGNIRNLNLQHQRNETHNIHNNRSRGAGGV